jgi:hypothetical protein
MSRQHHKLKCQTKYYEAAEKGLKSFELRKNDRNFQVYDMVELFEVVGDVFTGRKLPPKEIKYICEGGQFGLDKDYVILQLEQTEG